MDNGKGEASVSSKVEDLQIAPEPIKPVVGSTCLVGDNQDLGLASNKSGLKDDVIEAQESSTQSGSATADNTQDIGGGAAEAKQTRPAPNKHADALQFLLGTYKSNITRDSKEIGANVKSVLASLATDDEKKEPEQQVAS